MASPPPPSPHAAERGAIGASTAVCCMCGDHGLPGELVRCRRCRVRLQHRYCSDLYPRAAAYRRCNWCLREPASDHGGRAGHTAAAAVSDQPEEKRKAASASASASDEERKQRHRHEGCSSRRPPAESGHPVKKKHKAEEKMPPPQPASSAGAGKGIVTDTTGSSQEVMRAGKARVSRVKVRRYKLLAEVISC